MVKMTLVEAYRHYTSIEKAGQAIYCKGHMTGTLHRLVFHARQPGGVWYKLWLVSGDDVTMVGMHQDAVVYVSEPSDGLQPAHGGNMSQESTLVIRGSQDEPARID